MKLVTLCVCLFCASCATLFPKPPPPPQLPLYGTPEQIPSRSALRGVSGPVEEVSGLYSCGFEENCLVPDGVNEEWWPYMSKDMHDLYRTMAKNKHPYPPFQQVHVKMKGIKSQLGSYGHMGWSDREFYVTELLEMRPLSVTEPSRRIK